MKLKFKFHILITIGIIALYFITRLVNIKIIPIFTDEAIYTYWSKVALNDPANRFISLEDGKQPLFIWVAAVFQQFIEDPLIASRIVSILSGFGSLIGIYLLSKELFSDLPAGRQEKVAKLSSFLYVILPFTLLYDRLALFDSLLTMLCIFAVYLSVKMAKNPRLDFTLLNGFAIGLAMITKSSGNFFLYLLPFSLLLFNFRQKMILKNLSKWIGLSLVTFALSQIIYNSLRLSPLFYVIERKNYEFIRSASEIINDPFLFAFSNFKSLIVWLATYTSLPLFILFVICLLWGYLKKDLKIIYLSILIIMPFSAEVIFNKILYPRFALFYYPYILLLIAYFAILLLDSFKKFTKQLTIAFVIILFIPAHTSFKLLTNPAYANIPKSDSNQYFNDWHAGYGVTEIVQILKRESQNQIIYVGTQGTFGLYPHSLNIFLWKKHNVHILPFWPVDPENLPSEILEIAKNHKTYFIFNENQKEIINSDLKLVAKYQKGISNSYMRLYEVSPK